MAAKNRKEIGSISQYATYGGETSESPEVQTARSPAIETFKSPNAKKSKHPGWKQQTLYLPPDLIKWLKMQAVQEDREISEIAADLINAGRRLIG